MPLPIYHEADTACEEEYCNIVIRRARDGSCLGRGEDDDIVNVYG